MTAKMWIPLWSCHISSIKERKPSNHGINKFDKGYVIQIVFSTYLTGKIKTIIRAKSVGDDDSIAIRWIFLIRKFFFIEVA